MLTVTSPPLKEVRELAQRSMCKGGMLYTNDTGIPKKTSKYKESKYKVYYTTMLLVYADRHISPFEGSPRAGAAEYVQRGDVIYERYRNTEKNIEV